MPTSMQDFIFERATPEAIDAAMNLVFRGPSLYALGEDPSSIPNIQIVPEATDNAHCNRCHRCMGLFTPSSLAEFDATPAGANTTVPEYVETPRDIPPAPEGRFVWICRECFDAMRSNSGVGFCTTHNFAYVHNGDDRCPECHTQTAIGTNIMEMRQHHEGMPTLRFPRYVGLEIETGPWDRNTVVNGRTLSKDALAMGHRIDIHGDGSLEHTRDEHRCGWEIVTPPVTGRAVTTYMRFIYNSARKYGFSIENILAGAHVHVDARDLYCYLGRNLGESSTVFLLMSKYFEACIDVCMMFVSRRRRTNSYCNARFGIRSEAQPYISKRHSSFKGHGYCGIAIRGKTLEFRIWPSTNSMRNHLARVELSCKMVHALATCDHGQWAELTAQLLDAHAAKTSEAAISKLKRMLHLSDASCRPLVALRKKYYESRDPDKEIPDPDEYLRIRDKIMQDQHLTGEHGRLTAESLLGHPHTTWGDTLVYVPQLQGYLDLETLEPVPAGEAPYRYRM